jgi:hypothetical protein
MTQLGSQYAVRISLLFFCLVFPCMANWLVVETFAGSGCTGSLQVREDYRAGQQCSPIAPFTADWRRWFCRGQHVLECDFECNCVRHPLGVCTADEDQPRHRSSRLLCFDRPQSPPQPVSQFAALTFGFESPRGCVGTFADRHWRRLGCLDGTLTECTNTAFRMWTCYKRLLSLH